PTVLVAATTSDERLPHIRHRTRGFSNAVSRTGVTRARDEMTHGAEALVQRVRTVSDLPVAVGFGVSTPNQVREVWRFADAAVVGSALVREIEKSAIVREIEKSANSPNLVKRIGQFARSLLVAEQTGKAAVTS